MSSQTIENQSYDKSKGPLSEKSFAFAIRIVNLAKYLRADMNEWVLSKQVIRSGTAIGALIREAEYAESKADFAHKMSIALKEANETGHLFMDLCTDVALKHP